MTPTPDDVRLAKEWAASQDYPVTVSCVGHVRNAKGEMFAFGESAPDWLAVHAFYSEPEAWSFAASIIASVRPVIEREALKLAAKVCDTTLTTLIGHANHTYSPEDVAELIGKEIRSLITPPAKETT